MATWSSGGQLDWWVKERRPRLEWFGRVRGKDGKQRWIKAGDLHPPTARSHELSSGDQICGTTPARREERARRIPRGSPF